ncbi:uncharacterized protein LOC118205801 [Stegodyphus dumicola]|uniref:uncharacterized protein LOC118205801 n=1 Tax=Stegodyphus dumicola TaxID=202533 RepID=UPI0015B14FB1|nr:uncharacterized protein LOC118205801 [Stegodyphus dumicola]
MEESNIQGPERQSRDRLDHRDSLGNSTVREQNRQTKETCCMEESNIQGPERQSRDRLDHRDSLGNSAVMYNPNIYGTSCLLQIATICPSLPNENRTTKETCCMEESQFQEPEKPSRDRLDRRDRLGNSTAEVLVLLRNGHQLQ